MPTFRLVFHIFFKEIKWTKMEKLRRKIRNLEDHEMVNPKHHLSMMSLIHNRSLPNPLRKDQLVIITIHTSLKLALVHHMFNLALGK